MILRIFVSAALVASLVGAIQPQARDSDPNQQIRDLEWGDLNFLHTTDNHGWHAGHLQEPQYSADLGDYMSFVTHMRRVADEKGVDLLVVDSGDRSEGNGLYDASDPMGKYTRRILTKADHLDLLTSGNHELYNGTTSLNEWREMVPHFGDRYLSSNIEINATGEWEPFANRNLKFKTKNLGLTISAFGFLFDFIGNDVNTRVTPASQIVQEDWFRKAIADTEVDVFLFLCHIDVDFLELRFIHGAIRAIHPEVPIQFMAGHAHQRKFREFDSKCSALESGRYCETAGFLSLSGLVPKDKSTPRAKDGGPLKTFRRYIDYNRVNFQHHSNTTQETFDTEEGLAMSKEITGYREKLDLNRLIGCAPQDFTLDKSPYPSKDNWYSYLATTLLPTMIVNPARNTTPHMIFINGGSQRFDVFKGPFTYDTSFLISPFTSRFLFARDVPFSIASKLLDYFFRDPSPYWTGERSPTTAAGKSIQSVESIMTAMGETPPWDDRFDYANVLLGQASMEAKMEIKRPDSVQHVLTSESDDPSTDYHRVLGYTTIDDYGTDGDDTVHLPFAKYKSPKVIQSNASFPVDPPTDPEAVDVVFFDFIAKNVEAGLNMIAEELEVERRWKREAFERYMPKEATLTKLILEFVGSYWRKDCRSR